MLHDLPARGANGRHEPLRRPPTLVKRAEKTLWDAFQTGRPIDFRQNGNGHANGTGNGNGNGRARAWIYGPALPAEMIIAILRADPGQNRSARLELTGARITGAFDLSYARITHPITLRECEFDQPVVLADARLASLTLDDCTFPGLHAPNLEVDGDLGLSRVSSSATVRLTGSRLQRDLVLRGAHLHGGADVALADAGPADAGLADAGLADVALADVALAADHLVVEGSVLCDQGFEATGGVTMEAARVTGSIRLDGAKITGDDKEEVAFDGDGMTVGHEFRAHRLRADGQVSLVDVTIANALELRGATLNNPGGAALRLHRAEISSSLYCDKGFKAAGGIEAIGTHVKGSVYFNDAELGLPALPGLDGEVAGEAAEPPAGATALLLARMTIDGDLGCWQGFTAHLPIDLGRLTVGAELRLCTTALAGRPTSADLTSGHFGTLTIMGESPAGYLDLTKAKTEFFCDNGTARWADDRIVLDDFEYGAIQISPVTVKEREQWLLHAMTASARKSGWAHHGYVPQPYDQLAEAYRRAGDDPAARLIQLAKYRRRNSVTKWHDRWYSKVWNNLQDTVIGYGYAPRRALSWLLGLFVLGVVVFRYVSQPYSVVGHHHFTLNNSIAYTLDLMLPTSGLQERQVWQSANGLGEVAAALLVVFGWLLTATVFAAAARVLQRN